MPHIVTAFSAFTLLPLQSRMLDASCGLQLEVTHGRLWLTRADDITDYFVEAGGSIELREPQVLIQCDWHTGTRLGQAAHYRLQPLRTTQEPYSAPLLRRAWDWANTHSNSNRIFAAFSAVVPD